MQDYAAQIPVEDRWAIVAYERALQFSQHAAVGDVPDDRLRRSRSACHGASRRGPQAGGPVNVHDPFTPPADIDATPFALR